MSGCGTGGSEQQSVKHVLWIGGPPASGKTTIATRLARRYGVRLYSADTRTWEHRDRALLAENPADNPAYTATGVPFPGLAAIRLRWPASKRPPGAALHAKIIVIDDRIALVTSANLTNRAMETNLECGILIRGGPQPHAIRDHITGLQVHGYLRDERSK